ncbi:single-stranded DNA-binding protein [Parafrankia sp. EAN1pec]|uniref:single-stranded DNA-binding protein n=1 Tax=Parafrankia sp. (strain EAN1pec) TaxID=298653 RepID=UPI0003172236
MLDTTITLIGNLVENPVLRVTASGVSVCGFRVASTPRRYDRSEQRWVDGNTLYLRVSCWRQLAENVSVSLSRGDRALVVGRLRQNNFETQDGDRRVTYEIDADAVAAELTWRPVDVRRVARGAGPADEVPLPETGEHPVDPFGADSTDLDGGGAEESVGAGATGAGGLVPAEAVRQLAVETSTNGGPGLTQAGSDLVDAVSRDSVPVDFAPVGGSAQAAGAAPLEWSETGPTPASLFTEGGRGGELTTQAFRTPSTSASSGGVTFGLADVVGEVRLLGLGGAFG